MAERASDSIREVTTHRLASTEANAALITVRFAVSRPTLWRACTDPGQLASWFVPVSGGLAVGGRFALEGNASGTIERCEPPQGFFATWELGDSLNWIAVRLATVGARTTRLELEHLIPAGDAIWQTYGPGAVGVGWELALVGLARFVSGQGPLEAEEPGGWAASDKGYRYITGASAHWAQAAVAAGADPETARLWSARTTAFYTGATLPDET